MAIKKYTKFLSHRIKNRSNSRIFSNFAKRIGIVYFGYVNQHDDEHKLVRGLTVSSTIRDNNYCVGTVDDYSVSVVDRSDYTVEPDGKDILNSWIIFAIELHAKTAIPHFFVEAKNHDVQPYHSLFSTYPNMKEVDLGVFEEYSADFTSRFSVYARPAKSTDVQTIINAKISNVLAAHFWPMCIEQHDNVLYLYSTNVSITSQLLDSLLKNGLWLAGHLDKQIESED
ncbi:MAG: hypothetical protein NTV39_02570 [Candidatus Saccharibacteria bacterium]|nr:hypothetical protein [Candidatus Saccharibacteria bacterium]